MESANVVGYAETGLRFGAKGIGASFVKVDATDVNLQDLKATGYAVEDGYADEEVYVQTLDAFGRTIASYYWYDSEEDGYYGWYDDNGSFVNELIIAPGTSVYAYSPDNSFALVIPGVTL